MAWSIKYFLRKQICEFLDIPYSIYDFPPPFVKYLNKKHPVNVIDVGAHDGHFTQRINVYCGVKQGILIEPLPSKYKKLVDTFSEPKYSVYECVVSDTRDECTFNVNELGVTSSLLDFHDSAPILDTISFKTEAQIRRKSRLLDDIFHESGISNVDILKIDVQGAEHLVLNGAEKTLEATQMIWIEVSFKQIYQDSYLFSEIYSLLSKHNFMLVEISPGYRSGKGELLQGDALFKKSVSN
ncbi:FkbM family methyltransferase [Aphanizomenon sp. UHCC 0183]|uniref:FkbM family methyltransferase n=1 Tax=Aphanizomenon sp. UHCC 0183 TaxID=2590028 RepID=UPI00144606E6|nr:FkbM family methyltransferase [Aphanizomenon sp. UHCC 0183]MTJ32786.1 FkbM family methyltransferase [Aphanizomenon sp. UHCC 0183]